MPSPTYIDADTDPEVAAIDEAINAPSIPDREIIAPCYDGRGRLLPLFRLWMRDGYTLLSHAHTPGEAMGNAIDDARAIIERTGMARRMTNHEKRLATTVDCWRQVG
jgi:hypothetical protein